MAERQDIYESQNMQKNLWMPPTL